MGSAAIPGATGSADPATDPFYAEIPAELGAPGTVLKARPAPHLLQLAGLDWPGTATRIMYASTRQNGARTPVTGVLIEPTVEWEGKGPRPTVVIAPGTMGQGDQCAPSTGYGLFANIDAAGPSTAVNYELLNAYAAARRGIRVVITDYIGMGTPGVHTYVNSDDEGHAVLDAARAGLAAAGADPADPVGVLGYSQGGGAAAAAAERAGSYAPELNLTATYAGAPPADLRKVLAGIDGNMIVGTIGYALNSWMVYLDEAVDLDELIDRNLNEAGVRFLETTRGQCAVDSVLMWGRTRTAELTRDGSDFAAVLEREPAIAEVIDRQKLGDRAPDAPIRIVTGVHDDAIPTGQVRQLARDYCDLGATVGYGEDDTPRMLPGSSLNHLVPMVRGLPAALDYLVGAFTGEEPANDCGSL
ncbi:hypothetical protein CSPHI_03350 [Corynebacterium sphenisci DSM 44792]|uniref:Lipase n=1 Tax=Corynebacterium sphenisci DSM 44792 TaxID=1437874 RepID=A0A1L7CWP6_9CORY|nr:hypothetical protein CSPHI_03350 [Corynebacterium sphenisci DSM 44792]